MSYYKNYFNNMHCVKDVCIWGYSGPYFPALGLNTPVFGLLMRAYNPNGIVRAFLRKETAMYHK